METMDKRQTRNPASCLLRGLILLLCFHHGMTQTAKPIYYMDSSTDCYNAGYLRIQTDGVVKINSRKSSTSSSLKQCSIKFRPFDDRDIMDVRFDDYRISDTGVTLHLALSGSGSYTLSSRSNQAPRQMTSDGGAVTISLIRLNLDDNDYNFGITLRVYKKDDSQQVQDESPVAVGLVVGIISGVIIFLIFIAVVGVCCYRKKRKEYMGRGHAFGNTGEFADGAVTPSHSYGLDNTGRQRTLPYRDDRNGDYNHDDSPHLKHKLLTAEENEFEYRDHSGSDSDSKGPYIIRNFDSSPSKAAAFKYETEVPGRRPEQGNERVNRQNEGNSGRREGNQQRSPSASPAPNPQHTNPRFQAEGNTGGRRWRREEGDSDVDRKSDDSITGTVKAKAEADFDRNSRPEPLQRGVSKPPAPAPAPVPRSPKIPLRKPVADVRQTHHHSSSSSSEAEQLDNAGHISRNPEGEHSPSLSAKGKPDTRHTLRPDRGKGKKTPEKQKPSPDSSPPEPSHSKAKPSKSGASKSKPSKSDKADSKAKAASKQANTEYEGRFKKADNARKSKSKPPRIGRSRSTGHDLDDAESVGRGSVSSGYRAVPSVTADDFEDSDMESNYNPLRRTGSKTSLYASRSSLYGRRRRKNSVGESVYSVAYDDPDYDRFDRGDFRERSLSRRHRGFKSLGDLEMEFQEQSTRSTQTLRETATQTRGRKNSVSSTSGRSRSRGRKNSTSSLSGRPKRAKSESELRRKAREAEEDRETPADRPKPKIKPKPKPNPKPKPKPKPRKSTSASVSQLSDDDDMDTVQPVVPGQPVLVPQGYPGYMVGYPPQMPYAGAAGQPPMMVPYGAVPVQMGAVVPNSGGAAVPPSIGAPAPVIAPKPALSKWDMLVRMTDTAKGGDSYDTDSVAGSVFQ